MRALFLFLLLLVGACNRSTWNGPLNLPADSAALAGVHAKKVVFKGPVTFTIQHGNGNVATPTTIDNTQAGKKATAPAIGAGSTATATTHNGLPWWVPVAAIVVLLALVVNKLARGRWLL